MILSGFLAGKTDFHLVDQTVGLNAYGYIFFRQVSRGKAVSGWFRSSYLPQFAEYDSFLWRFKACLQN